MSSAVLAAAERRLQSGNVAVDEVVLDICVVLRSGSLEVVHQALQMLAPLFLQCGDNTLRQTMVASLNGLDVAFPAERDLLVPVFRVLDSNDPIARGLTLQALGHLARLIRDRDDIHFRILERLESEHPLEQESAIFCVTQLVHLNDAFAGAVLRRIPDLFQSQSHGGDGFKLGIIRVLSSMTHADTSVSSEARRQLIYLMEARPTEHVVVAGIEALTQMTIAVQAFTDAQLDLLWSHLLQDPRPRVKFASISGMVRIAATCSLVGNFRPEMALALLSRETDDRLLSALLALIAMLARSWYVNSEEYDLAPLSPFLVSDSLRQREWALRALSKAALAYPRAAHALLSHVEQNLRSHPFSCEKRGTLYTAALSLCLPQVSVHSPGIGERVLGVLIASCQVGMTPSESVFALLHAVAVGASRVAFEDSSTFVTKLASLADGFLNCNIAEGWAAECFCATAVAIVHTLPLVQQDVTRDFGVIFGPVMKKAEARVNDGGAWRWAWYRVAREAMAVGIVVPVVMTAAKLAHFPLPESSRVRNWMLWMSEWCRAQAEAQAGNVVEACMAMRRSHVILEASCPPSVLQSSQLEEVPFNSRSHLMRFQRRFSLWKLNMLETAPSRASQWEELGREALSIRKSFCDMPQPCVRYLEDCAACCFAIAGKGSQHLARRNSSWWPADTSIARLLAALENKKLPPADQLADALRVASSPLPRYFFQSSPRIWVTLSVSKPKMSSLSVLSTNEAGNVVSLDGVIHQGRTSLRRTFKGAKVMMQVAWTPDKASVLARRLAGEQRVRKGVRMVVEQNYSADVVGDVFNVVALLPMPFEPRQGHVVSVRVSLTDGEEETFDDLALLTFLGGALSE